ncbi:MAG: hypothetical protein WC816_08535 [Sphingomonas sp.]|jgi:hypothetical protein
MHKKILIAAIPLALSLAACQQKAEVVTAQAADPQAELLKSAPPVKLPPSIKEQVTMRCKDNSLVYVDFFNGDTQANLRTEKSGPLVKLTADKAGDPLKADGYSLTGTPSAITLVQPGKASLTCKK